MAAAPAPGSSLDASFCAALCTRLSAVPDLQLPSSLCREQQEPGPEAIQKFLQALLQRDPAVFLERYSSLLTSSDLDSFHPLRSNYEVNFWLNHAQQQQHDARSQHGLNQQQQQQQQGQSAAADGSSRNKAASKTAANRRLAFMYKLEQQGEYFSESSMRAREPLVWHEYIGQFEGQPPPPTGPQPGEGLGFAGSLLSAHDEVLVRARLQQQLQDEECQLSEQEDSDSEDAEGAADTDLDATDGKVTDEGSRGNGVQKQQQQQQEQSRVERGGRDEPMPDAGGAAGGSSNSRAAPQQQQQQQQQEADMSTGAMRRRRQELLEEMQSRFLLGLDGEHQEYADIDGDAALDEAWAAQQAQDAEDAYFDAD